MTDVHLIVTTGFFGVSLLTKAVFKHLTDKLCNYLFALSYFSLAEYFMFERFDKNIDSILNLFAWVSFFAGSFFLLGAMLRETWKNQVKTEQLKNKVEVSK